MIFLHYGKGWTAYRLINPKSLGKALGKYGFSTPKSPLIQTMVPLPAFAPNFSPNEKVSFHAKLSVTYVFFL